MSILAIYFQLGFTGAYGACVVGNQWVGGKGGSRAEKDAEECDIN
jgi:hypothetical protein